MSFKLPTLFELQIANNNLFVKISAFDRWLRNCVATRETTYCFGEEREREE